MDPANVKVPLRQAGQQHRFDPQEVTIKVGGTVIWTNEDTEPHTVTPEDGNSFPEGILDIQGATYSNKFTAEGEYPYFCQVHGIMTGKVIVIPASAG
ncbi:plastocyanin/azurin family copper-binding protein (plasmid) [Rhizobium ruizarguesonis]|nr:plastocyanin/azurin family copper-binding protein [Rhizobium ruizarguesonis]